MNLSFDLKNIRDQGYEGEHRIDGPNRNDGLVAAAPRQCAQAADG